MSMPGGRVGVDRKGDPILTTPKNRMDPRTTWPYSKLPKGISKYTKKRLLMVRIVGKEKPQRKLAVCLSEKCLWMRAPWHKS